MSTLDGRLSAVASPAARRMGVGTGVLAQLVGLLGATGLLALAVGMNGSRGVRIALLITGWLAVYLSSHAVAHWGVGLLVGIGFRGFAIRGTDHPQTYPPGLRQVMSAAPFWVAVPDRASLRRATPRRRAAMLGAGMASTTLCSLGAAGAAAAEGAPGARIFLLVVAAWLAGATVTSFTTPRGDYRRALVALRESPSSHSEG